MAEAGTRAFLKSIGSDEISPLFQKALTYSVAPAMATTTDALAAFVRWDLYQNSMLRFMENYDAVLSTVAPFPALLHGTSFDDDNRRGFGYAQAYNLTGWPTATVRVGTSPEGLPLGVQVAARPGVRMSPLPSCSTWRTRSAAGRCRLRCEAARTLTQSPANGRAFLLDPLTLPREVRSSQWPQVHASLALLRSFVRASALR